jgi:muramoyltetrapeptide carboxypeptidase
MFNRLNQNCTVGIISPAWIPEPGRLNAGIKYLESRGFNVKKGLNLDKRFGYFSGTDEERIADLHQMYSDPDVDIILCSRGGWGGLRLIENLDYDLIAKNPKPLIGYSDITTLQLAIWKKTAVPSYSGPMAGVEMGKGIHPFSERHLWGQLFNNKNNYELNISSTSAQIKVNGTASGTLLGGCLSLVCHLLGTPYSPEYEGSVLVLEDVGEQPYKIDRYLAHLKQAGIFDKINALILGEFLDCEDEDEKSFTVEDLFDQYFSNVHFPVIQNFPYGHGNVKFSMPVGLTSSLNTVNKTLTVGNPFRLN